MTNARRKSSSGFAMLEEELPTIVEEAVVEKTVVEKIAVVAEITEEVKKDTPLKEETYVPIPVTEVRLNPKPVKPSESPRRNTPKFSTPG
jgi:hypothetical protein